MSKTGGEIKTYVKTYHSDFCCFNNRNRFPYIFVKYVDGRISGTESSASCGVHRYWADSEVDIGESSSVPGGRQQARPETHEGLAASSRGPTTTAATTTA